MKTEPRAAVSPSAFLAHRDVRRAAAMFTALLAVFIMMVCLLPAADLANVKLTDKTEHFIAYLVFAAPLAIALGRGRLWLTLLIAIGYGGLVELAQAAAPTGRTASWLDALANAIGAGLGTGLMASLFAVFRGK
jgi:VanZ family protein